MATTRIGLVDFSQTDACNHPAPVKDLAAWPSSGFCTCLPKFWHPAAGLFTHVAARIAPSQDAQPQRLRARSPVRPSESAHVSAASMGGRLLPFVLGTTFPNGISLSLLFTIRLRQGCFVQGLSPRPTAHRTIALSRSLASCCRFFHTCCSKRCPNSRRAAATVPGSVPSAPV